MTVAPVEGTDPAFSGWVRAAGDSPLAFDTRTAPWARRFSAGDLEGVVRADGDGRLKLRAQLFRGPFQTGELGLEGSDLWFVTRADGVSGRAR